MTHLTLVVIRKMGTAAMNSPTAIRRRMCTNPVYRKSRPAGPVVNAIRRPCQATDEGVFREA